MFSESHSATRSDSITTNVYHRLNYSWLEKRVPHFGQNQLVCFHLEMERLMRPRVLRCDCSTSGPLSKVFIPADAQSWDWYQSSYLSLWKWISVFPWMYPKPFSNQSILFQCKKDIWSMDYSWRWKRIPETPVSLLWNHSSQFSVIFHSTIKGFVFIYHKYTHSTNLISLLWIWIPV